MEDRMARAVRKVVDRRGYDEDLSADAVDEITDDITAIMEEG